MRTIKKIHHSEYRPIADLITYSPLPSRTLNQISPFIFLNHHGFQIYKPMNQGLPFGPHPHRGMETVTFILDGDILHKDSEGHVSVVNSGGVQWMTAGSGLIHAEVSSPEFKMQGGPLEILQLWINLPAEYKMTSPFYKGLQKEDIPKVNLVEGKAVLNLISGEFDGIKGPFESLTSVFMSTISLDEDAAMGLNIPKEKSIFFYVVKGSVAVNKVNVAARNLVEFENDSTELEVHALKGSFILFGYADPILEPMVAQGPFVMNSEAEIQQAYEDYRQGKFGTWNH
jgi:quercetin 2,3-dioxygenase